MWRAAGEGEAKAERQKSKQRTFKYSIPRYEPISVRGEVSRFKTYNSFEPMDIYGVSKETI